MISKQELNHITNEYKTFTRWWLAEGFHTDETLKNEFKLLDECGIGAVEFVAVEEPGADSALYGWGSEEWVHDSQLIFEEATRRGMGVSATCGTNWANCNLTGITPDDPSAAKELDFVLEVLKPGEVRTGWIPECKLTVDGVTKQDLVAVVSAKFVREDAEAEEIYLDPLTTEVLTDRVKDGELTYAAPEDETRYLLFFYIHGTGQTAGPSADVSYTVNYMDKEGIEAFKKYWDAEVLTQSLRDTIRENGHAMMYMDSLELTTFCKGGQFWGYHLLDEFRERRGYDLTPYLPFIVKEGGFMPLDFVYQFEMEDKILQQKIWNDLYETMTDLYMENMMKPMQEWCHSHGMQLRAEISYGLPFEISRPAKYVDGLETESLEFAAQIESYRNLAGPAHVYNKIYSSETGATRSNYMMGLNFYMQMIYTQFAAGVTRTVLHGYSSIAGSEDSTYWPGHEGMWPIFSERFGSRQPAYAHYPDWNRMIARYQKVLRSGQPRMDLAIIRLDYNFHNIYGRLSAPHEREYHEHMGMRGHEGAYWKDMKLQDHGFTWDYFAPHLLEEDFMITKDGLLMPEGPAYQAVIIYQDTLPYSTAEKLLSLAKAGLPVLFVNHTTERMRPIDHDRVNEIAAARTPFNDGLDEKLQEIVSQMKALPNVREVNDQSQTYEALIELGVHPRTEFTAPVDRVLTLTRQDGDTTYFYCYNFQYAEKENASFEVKLPASGRVYEIDCWNGEIKELGNYQNIENATILSVCLAPGQAKLYAVDAAENESGTAAAPYAVNLKGADTAYIENGSLMAHLYGNGDKEIMLSDGSVVKAQGDLPADIDLPVWKLSVEDWNEGEKKTIVEDRGKGIVTNEVYYETRKDLIDAGEVSLIPWKDIPAVGPEVSGMGHYSVSVDVPQNYDETMGAELVLGNCNQCTAAVSVNGEEMHLIDMEGLTCDITGKLHAGKNTICVDVSSSLKNRLLARGYYKSSEAESQKLSDKATNGYDNDNVQTVRKKVARYALPAQVHLDLGVESYGLTESAKIRFYKKVKL